MCLSFVTWLSLPCLIRRWLLDPSYDVMRDKRLQEKCCELLSDGHEIGLHGSFYSAEDEKLFLNEKEALEEVVNTGIKLGWNSQTNNGIG